MLLVDLESLPYKTIQYITEFGIKEAEVVFVQDLELAKTFDALGVPTSEWVHITGTNYERCKNCQSVHSTKYRYCPECGLQMINTNQIFPDLDHKTNQ